MTPFSQRAVHRMTAVKEREHRGTAHSDSFEGSADTEIAPCRDHTLLQGIDCLGCAASLVVHLRQVQVELGVVHSHSQGFAAERLSIAEALLGDCSQKACIREIERVLRSNSQGAPGML